MSIMPMFFSPQGGAVSTAFIISAKTDNSGSTGSTQILLPIQGGTYNIETSEHSLTGQTAPITLTFASAGTYDIEITEDTPTTPYKCSNLSYGDRLKIVDVKNFGSVPFVDYRYGFYNFDNIASLTATDSFNFDSVAVGSPSLNDFFFGNAIFASGVANWTNFGIITSMSQMFRDCPNFNEDISGWDVSGITNMGNMFWNCGSFDQDLSSWQITQVTNLTNFMILCTLSTANYDALLIAWDAQGSMSFSGTAHFGSSKYTSGGAAEAARTSLISKWGGITDGGAA